MAFTLAPYWPGQFFRNDGSPAATDKVFVYEAGTSTKTTTYQDAAGATPNTNPIILDSSGRANVFLNNSVGQGAVKFVQALAADTDPPTSPYKTIDSVSAVPSLAVNLDVPVTAGENLAADKICYMGVGFLGTTPGEWYLADASATPSSSDALQLGFPTTAIARGSTGVMRIQGRVTGLSALNVGNLYFIDTTPGGITATAPANKRGIGIADTTTSLLLGAWQVPGTWYTLSSASATVAGIVDLSAQTLGDGLKHFKQRPTFNPGTSDATPVATTSGILPNSVSATVAGNVTTGETTLWTYSLPANVLDHSGAMLRIVVWGSIAATANTKTGKLKFGATSATIISSTANNASWIAEAWLINTGAATQVWYPKGTIVTSASTTQEVRAFPGSPGETTSGAITVQFTGQSSAATDDIIKLGAFIEVLN